MVAITKFFFQCRYEIRWLPNHHIRISQLRIFPIIRRFRLVNTTHNVRWKISILLLSDLTVMPNDMAIICGMRIYWSNRLIEQGWIEWGGMILCSLAGCLLHCLENLMPNSFNKPHRPRYALSMTVLRRVIAVTTDKNKGTILASHCLRCPVHFRGASLRKSVRFFDIESYSRCIDIHSNKISLGLCSLGYITGISSDLFEAFACRIAAKAMVDNFLLNASYIHRFEKPMFTKIMSIGER